MCSWTPVYWVLPSIPPSSSSPSWDYRNILLNPQNRFTLFKGATGIFTLIWESVYKKVVQ